MDSQFSIITAAERQQAINLLHDNAETTHFPEQLDHMLHYLLQKQMLHTLHEITDKILHCGYVVDQIKHIANELTDKHDEHLTSPI